MALAILDGTQTATTLSTILSSGQHITAHTVISLGTQAITDMRSAVSGTSVCVGSISISGTPSVTGSVSVLNFPASQSTTFGAVTGSVSVLNFPATQAISISSVTVGNSVTIASLPAISGTVTALGISNLPLNMAGSGLGFDNSSRLGVSIIDTNGTEYSNGAPFPTYFTNSIPAGAARIGVVTASLSAGTAQIGSVTASINGTVPISISSVTVGNSVTIGSLPAISGTVTANLSISSTAITSGSFASLTSATLVPGNTARKMATVYNLGAGQLFVNAGASATTLGGGFMVALSSGDFYECDYTTTTLSAIFATAGTASWVSH